MGHFEEVCSKSQGEIPRDSSYQVITRLQTGQQFDLWDGVSTVVMSQQRTQPVSKEGIAKHTRKSQSVSSWL